LRLLPPLLPAGPAGELPADTRRRPARARPTVGAVVLTTGSRPEELALALSTLLGQRDIDLDVVVVGNGWRPNNLPEGVRCVSLPANVGVPEGRNIGARHVRGELVFFFDDDAVLPSPDVVVRLAAALEAHPRAALVQPRPVDPTGLPSPRRWVPRLRVRDGRGGGVVGVFWEGVFLIRRTAFAEVGCWAGDFFFGHEGIDLAWRLWDADWCLRYEPSIVVRHPARPPHATALAYRLDARNRAWVARRNLPLPVAVLHVLAWALITVLRGPGVHPLPLWFAGLREGLTSDCGPRRPMRWRTVVRLTATGRPPIL
jgi:GT2 family glycosyltransferase